MTWMFRLLFLAFVLPLSAPPAASQDTQDCKRPDPPFNVGISDGSEFAGAVESYYAQATRYIACLDGFIGEIDTRYAAEIDEVLRQYREQHDAEIADYATERAEVMEELRAVVDEHAAAMDR